MRSRPKRAAPSSLLPAPTSPATPSTSPRRSSKETSAQLAGGQLLGAQQHFAAATRSARSASCRSRPTMRRMISAGVVAAVSTRRHGLPVAQHRDAVRDTKHLVHLVRDVHHRDAALLQRSDQAEQPLHGVIEERTGGLVHQQDARIHAQRAGDGQQLPPSDGKSRHHLAQPAIEAHLLQERPAEGLHAAGFHQRAFRKMQVADHHVLARR